MKTSLVLNSGHGIKKSKVKAKNDVCTMWMQKNCIKKIWQEHNKIITNIHTKN